MADDRTDIPGSGTVEPDERGPDAPPPSPQATHYEGPADTGQSESSRWPFCLLIGLGGCGCLLVVLLVLGIIGGVGWSIFDAREPQEPPSNTTSPPSDAQIEQPSGSTDGERNPAPTAPDAQPTADPVGEHVPGPQAAIGWANNRRSDWQATINDHSDDWHQVRLLMGPPASEWTTWVEIQWNEPSGRYGLVDEGPIAVDDPDEGAVPRIFMPSEEVAKEAAVGYVEQPDWVARVDSHSDDWRSASVSVGPPASEFVWIVNLTWNDQIEAYDLVSIDDVDYPGME